ncbi:MAG TPA: N-acetylmuramoyl-L-alanine amidase CwlD [Clostridiaceae bacterium]|nr:N-acetylmuramoyl-L-alanine amidase CwlD [Clostridiaceae bacterium]
MIVIIRKRNIGIITLVFVLLLAVYSFSFNIEDKIREKDISADITGESTGDVQDEAEEVSSSISTDDIENKLVENTGKDGEKAADPKDDGQRTVVVDAGHGGEDPGAVSDNGLKEKDVTLKIAFKLKDKLEKENYKVIMTRTEDILQYDANVTDIYEKRRQDLTRRKSIMDSPEADIVVSIHLNKFTQPQYYGAQVFYPPESPESRKLAQIIQSVLKEKVDPTNKRVALEKKPLPGQKPIVILRDIKTPTVIVECGFLSNPEEERKLGTDEYQEKLAEAIKEGIDKYFAE